MHSRFHSLVLASLAAVATSLVTTSSAQAVILFGDPDTKYIAPTGEYASIPWGKVAYKIVDDKPNPAWPVSPNWALRARHVGGSSTALTQNGVNYTILESVQVAGSDLELIRVDAPFSSYFNMYRGSDEIGKEIVMFGTSNAGRKNDDPLTPTNESEVRAEGTNRFNGWYPGDPEPPKEGESGILNWGRNVVRDNVNVFGTDTLEATFDAPGAVGGDSVGVDEAIAYNGDSGGAFFIQQAGEWRLAGVTYAVSAGYLTKDGPLFIGPIFDARDLYGDFYVNPNNPAQGTERRLITGDNPVPFGTYASRVSTYRSSIDTITGQTEGLGAIVVPEASAVQLFAIGVGGLAGVSVVRRRRRSA